MNLMKYLSLAIFVLVVVSAAAGAPDEPHRVFGEINDEDDNSISSEIEFVYEEDIIEVIESDSEGYYDTLIEYSADYNGESVTIRSGSDDQELEEFTFERLGTDNIDLVIELEDEEDESTTENGNGGGAGGAPPSDEDEEVDEEIVGNIKDGEAGLQGINNAERVQASSDHGSIRSIELEINSQSSVMSFQVQEQDNSFENTINLDHGINYIQISTEGLENSEITDGTIEFEIPRASTELDHEYWSGQFYKYEGGWNERETRFLEETEVGYLYEADVDGFSNFASAAEPDYEMNLEVEYPEEVEIGEEIRVNATTESPLETAIYWNEEEGENNKTFTFEDESTHEIEIRATDENIEENQTIKINAIETKETDPLVGQFFQTSSNILIIFVTFLIAIAGTYTAFKRREN